MSNFSQQDPEIFINKIEDFISKKRSSLSTDEILLFENLIIHFKRLKKESKSKKRKELVGEITSYILQILANPELSKLLFDLLGKFSS